MEDSFKMHIVAHTHWDREWYYSLEEYRYRLIKLMDILLDCMDRDIITYFTLDGQTIALEDYFTVRPENRDRVKKLTKAGRLIIGPWYTQPNVFMSGAEAQVRNLLRGKKDMLEYGGGLEHINHMPDQFGYTSQLPQMMEGFGLHYLVGARGLPKGCDTFFVWEGADGTEVKVCAMPHSYINACAFCDREEQKVIDVFGCQIVLPSLPDRLNVVLDEKRGSIAPHLLAMNGVDHMYPNPSMLSTIEKIKQLHPELEVEQSTFEKYISEVEGSLVKDITKYSGEQRDPRENLILPASQSMRMDVKKYNVRMEDMLTRTVEPLFSVMESLGSKRLPKSELRMAWDIMLENHAHDSLCCSNAEASYREILVRYEKIDDITREICSELDQRFIRRIRDVPNEALIIHNPSGQDRNEPVEVEVIVAANRNFAEPHIYCDGAEIPSYVLGVKPDTLLRFVPFSGLVGQLSVAVFKMAVNPGTVPATGYKTLEIRGGYLHAQPVEGLVKGLKHIENEALRVDINPDATVSVLDKLTGQRYTGLNSFIDNGEAGNGFQHVPPYKDDIAVSSGKDISVTIVENNPLRGIINVSQKFTVPAGLTPDMLSRNRTKTDLVISLDIILKSGSRHVEFITRINNTASDHRLRVAFPTDIDSGTAYAGQPFDVVERLVQPDNVNVLEYGDYEAYVGYHPMNDFCGISDGIRGAAAAGDGIMEYEVLPMRHTLCLTLLRSTDRLLVGVLATGSKFKLPSAQLRGESTFRYSFIPHTGGYENVLEETERFRHPLRYVQKDFLEAESMPDYVPEDDVLPMSAGFVKVSGGGVLTSIKPSENGNGVIVRMFNPTDRKLELMVSVDSIYELIDARSVRLDETQEQFLAVEDNRIELTAEPKKIITLSLNIALRRQ